MDLMIDPPRGAGPIAIGMSLERAEQALRTIAGFKPPEPGAAHGFAHYESEMSIALGLDRNRIVKSVEIYRPSREVNVLYRGISVFGLAADDVIRQLSSLTRLEIDDNGLGVVAPELLLSLGRYVLPEGPDDEDGRYFESVLVAAPGYYD